MYTYLLYTLILLTPSVIFCEYAKVYENSVLYEPIRTQNYYISTAIFITDSTDINNTLTNVLRHSNNLKIWLQQDPYRNKGYNLKLSINYIDLLPSHIAQTFTEHLKTHSVSLFYNVSQSLSLMVKDKKINLVILAASSTPPIQDDLFVLGKASTNEHFYYYHLSGESSCSFVNGHEFGHTVLDSKHELECNDQNTQTLMAPRLSPCPDLSHFRSGIECDPLLKLPKNNYERLINLDTLNKPSVLYNTMLRFGMRIVDATGYVLYYENSPIRLAPFLNLFNYYVPVSLNTYNSVRKTVEFAKKNFTLAQLAPVDKNNRPQRTWGPWVRQQRGETKNTHRVAIFKRECQKNLSIFDTCPPEPYFAYIVDMYHSDSPPTSTKNSPSSGRCFDYKNSKKFLFQSGEPCTVTVEHELHTTAGILYQKFHYNGICIEGVCMALDSLVLQKYAKYNLIHKYIYNLSELLYPDTIIPSCTFLRNVNSTYNKKEKAFLKWVNETTPANNHLVYPIVSNSYSITLYGTSLCNKFARFVQANSLSFRIVAITRVNTTLSFSRTVFADKTTSPTLHRSVCSVYSPTSFHNLNEYECVTHVPYYQLNPVFLDI